MNWLQRTLMAIREVSNWFYVRRTVREGKKSEQWKEFGLRTGYVGQVYTVISLRKEDMGEEEMVQRMKVVEKIEPIGKYLDSLGLSEVIYPEIVFIPNTRSWLVVFWPLQQYFSMWRLIFWILGLSLFTYFAVKWQIFQTIASWI
jgi:hypothetical protein